MSRAGPNKPSDTRQHQLLKIRRATAQPTLKAALCHDAYTKFGLRAPNNLKVMHTTRVAAIPRASLFIIGRCITT